MKNKETLEEAQKKQFNYDNLHDAKEISSHIKVVERSYSEEEVYDIVDKTIEKFYKHIYSDKTKAEMKDIWFEQFKKK